MEALNELSLSAGEATAVVQGYGNVGSVVSQELVRRGIHVIALGDRYGSIRNSKGIDLAALNQHVAAGKLLRDFTGAETIPNDELLKTPCTILVPAALE